MSRLEFMKELAKLLEDLPRDEKIEILKYYNGYFDDAGEEKEADIIRELGSPAKVAASVKAGMDESMAEHMEFTEKGVDDEKTVQEYEERRSRKQDEQQEESHSFYYEDRADARSDSRNVYPRRKESNSWKIIAIALIIIVTFPVWIGLVGALIGLIGGLFGLLVGLIAAVVGGLVACLASGVACVVSGFAKILFSPLSGMMSISVGILLLGVGLLCLLLCGLFFGKLIPWIIGLIGRLFRWIGSLFGGRRRA